MSDIMTAEQIAEKAEKIGTTDRGVKIAMNALFRNQDQSNLAPINGKFSVVKRAIGRVRKMERANGAIYGLEYAYAIEHEESQIVNDEKNWG